MKKIPHKCSRCGRRRSFTQYQSERLRHCLHCLIGVMNPDKCRINTPNKSRGEPCLCQGQKAFHAPKVSYFGDEGEVKVLNGLHRKYQAGCIHERIPF